MSRGTFRSFYRDVTGADERNRQALGRIMSGQTIPAFARAGGAEPDSPENIRRAQMAQMAELGTPEALKALGQISPVGQDPYELQQRKNKQRALGALAPALAERYNAPTEDVLTMLQGGVTPSALGSLYQQPQEELVQVYDGATGQMKFVPKSQAKGQFASAPMEQDRKIVEQGGVQYFADTGEPVIKDAPTPVNKDTVIKGLEVVEGAAPTKDDAKTIKTIKQAKTQIENLVGDYENLVKKYGYEPSFTKGGKLIRQKKAQIDLQAKNLEELGALQEADRAILGDMLGDPTGLTNPYNAKDIALTQIDDYKKYINDRYNTALETRGYKEKAEESEGDLSPSEQAELERLKEKYNVQ